MTNSHLPGWFRWADPSFGKEVVDAEPLDYLALAKDFANAPATFETRHYILCLLRRIEDEHAFRRTPLNADELEACRILKGFLKQIEEIRL